MLTVNTFTICSRDYPTLEVPTLLVWKRQGIHIDTSLAYWQLAIENIYVADGKWLMCTVIRSQFAMISCCKRQGELSNTSV